jgi:hypothetical protein
MGDGRSRCYQVISGLKIQKIRVGVEQCSPHEKILRKNPFFAYLGEKGGFFLEHFLINTNFVG